MKPTLLRPAIIFCVMALSTSALAKDKASVLTDKKLCQNARVRNHQFNNKLTVISFELGYNAADQYGRMEINYDCKTKKLNAKRTLFNLGDKDDLIESVKTYEITSATAKKIPFSKFNQDMEQGFNLDDDMKSVASEDFGIHTDKALTLVFSANLENGSEEVWVPLITNHDDTKLMFVPDLIYGTYGVFLPKSKASYLPPSIGFELGELVFPSHVTFNNALVSDGKTYLTLEYDLKAVLSAIGISQAK